MNNLGILIKNNFNMLLGRLQGKKERKPVKTAITMLVFGVLAIVALYTYQAYTMFNGLGRIGLCDLVLFHGILISLSVMLIVGVMRVSANQKHNDADLLMSLPIKKIDIVFSKLLNYYFFDLFFSVLMMLPYVVLYQVFASFNVWVLIRGLLCIFLLPLFSVGVSCLLDWIVRRLFNRLACGNLLKSMFAVFVFIVVIAMMMLKTMFYGSVTIDSMQNYFADRFFTKAFLDFILNCDGISLVVVLLTIFVPFVLGVVVYYNDWGKSFSKFQLNKKALKFGDDKGEIKSLLKKELGTYSTTVGWIVNSIIGPVLMMVIGVMVACFGLGQFKSAWGVDLDKNVLAGLMAIVFCGMVAMTIISCCSVSLEGKQFWLLKSSPVNEKNLLTVKALLQIVVVEPFILVSSMLLAVKLKFDFAQLLLVFGLPTILNLICSFGGVLLNLFFPSFDWEDETKVVKQSLSTLLTMVGGMILTVLGVVLYALVGLSFRLTLIITIAVYLFVLAIILLLLYTKGIKRYREL